MSETLYQAFLVWRGEVSDDVYCQVMAEAQKRDLIRVLRAYAREIASTSQLVFDDGSTETYSPLERATLVTLFINLIKAARRARKEQRWKIG